jgi:hypothetical protein
MRFVITEEEKDQIRDLYDDKWNRFYRCMRRRHDTIDSVIESAIKDYSNIMFGDLMNETEFVNNIVYIVADTLESRDDFDCVEDEDSFDWIHSYVSDNWKDYLLNFYIQNIKKS